MGFSSAKTNPLTTAFPAVDSFTIAGSPMPGKWTLLEAPRQFGWDIRQGYGLSGAVVFPKGDPLVVAKFKGEFWSEADFAVYKVVRKTLLDRGAIQLGGLANALGIWHPELKALGVESVVVLKVTPAIQEEGGLWVVHVDFLQYRAPVLPPPRPKFVIPDTAQLAPSPQTAQQAENQRLSSQIDALLGR